MQHVTVDTNRFACRLEGNETGPVVMMAHAMGTSHQLWDLQLPALEDRYRVLRYDWRGHGDSSAPPGPYSLSEFVADAVGVMDAFGLDRVHWVGISTGGMIGQGLGIGHPERIASLTLCNTTSIADDAYRDWVKQRQAVVRQGGMVPVWDMTRALWFTEPFIAAASPDYHAVRDAFVRTPIDGYLGGTSAVARLDYREDLHRITAPVRIIAAGADPVTPVERSREIRDRVSGSVLHVIDGMRHFSNVESPAEFNRILRQGLDEMVA